MTHAFPAVSVVVPVYNTATTIAETLDSLFAQSLDNFEVIIVDDGSMDNSMEIVRRYDDPRCKVITQKNRGLNGARNSGIRHSRAPYIAFLDADDLWRPQMLERHVAHLNAHPKIGISFSPSALIGEDSQSLGMRQRPKLRDITARDVICRNPIGNGSAGVFRREVFDEIAFTRAETPDGETWWFDETYRQSTDIECWMRIVAQTDWQFQGLPEVLVDYRVNAGGLSANTGRQLMYWEKALAKLAELRPDLAQTYGRLARAYQLRYLARRAVSGGDGHRAFDLIRQALKEDYRIAIQEPVKSAVTLGASTVLCLRDMILKPKTV